MSKSNRAYKSEKRRKELKRQKKKQKKLEKKLQKSNGEENTESLESPTTEESAENETGSAEPAGS